MQPANLHNIFFRRKARHELQKKNPIFTFKGVRVRLRESDHLQECVNTELDWESKKEN